jgi:F420-dependent oxidoreductase-like protein
MRFAIFTGLGLTTWDAVRDLWIHADRSGWDAACVTDHFMPNTPDKAGDVMECWTTLAALAPLVPRMRIGTIVAGNTYRHPAVLAKMAAQVDIVSGGRLVCGLGAAWQQNEHEAYGIPFYTVPERLARLDEACQVLKMLWTQERSHFKGRYYQLTDAPLAPKPVQRPHPELMIGGGGEKVTLRIVARHADHWNVWGGPDVLARKCALLDGYDRLHTALTKRFGMTDSVARDTMLAGSSGEIRDKLGRLREAGVETLFVPTLFMKDPRPALDRFMKEIAPQFR